MYDEVLTKIFRYFENNIENLPSSRVNNCKKWAISTLLVDISDNPADDPIDVMSNFILNMVSIASSSEKSKNVFLIAANSVQEVFDYIKGEVK